MARVAAPPPSVEAVQARDAAWQWRQNEATLEDIARALAARGVWWPADPPVEPAFLSGAGGGWGARGGVPEGDAGGPVLRWVHPSGLVIERSPEERAEIAARDKELDPATGRFRPAG